MPSHSNGVQTIYLQVLQAPDRDTCIVSSKDNHQPLDVIEVFAGWWLSEFILYIVGQRATCFTTVSFH